jgi:hypothetical protein
MDMFGQVKNVVRELIDISVVLMALAIVLTILVGGSSLPFVGNVVGNMMSMVKDLGSNGVVGLIVLGVIVWLFSGNGKAVARK